MNKNELFNPEEFADMVLQKIGMDKAKPDVLKQLKVEIIQTLSDTIIETMKTSLSEKDLVVMDKMMKENSELDEFDCLSIIISSNVEMQRQILKAVDDLYVSLVSNGSKLK